jgi:hypothetical protein
LKIHVNSLAGQVVFSFILFLTFSYCTPQEEVVSGEVGSFLVFSQDTIRFDTVFTERGSTSRRIRLLNTNQNAVNINQLAVGSSSPFQISVNGLRGKSFEDVILFGGDSLLIIVDVLIDPNEENMPFIVEDRLTVVSNQRETSIPLIAWGQNANYIPRGVLDCETVWTNQRPYVVLDTIIVDDNCLLSIEEGTQVFFDFGAALFVAGSLNVNGSATEKVSILNSRQDEPFKDAPGQWGGIFILEGSGPHAVDHAIIRNGDFGLRIGSPDDNAEPDVVVTNTIIENMFFAGIIAFTSDVHLENTLIDNCRQFAFAGIGGGNYSFNHCTLANFPVDFIREGNTAFFNDNLELSSGDLIVDDLSIEMQNTIVWGSGTDEFVIDNSGNQQIALELSFSILRISDESLDGINGIQINQDPNFVDPLAFDFHLDTLSAAKDAGIITEVVSDLESNPRDSLPDLGAYERIED